MRRFGRSRPGGGSSSSSSSTGNWAMIVAILGVSAYCYYLSVSDTTTTSSGIRNAATQSKQLRAGATEKGGFVGALQKQQQQQQHQSTKSLHSRSDVKEKQCTIYVAPSSLKGNPGYGIYTTRDLFKGEAILGGPDGVSIPVEAYGQMDVPKRKEKRQWINLWNPYWWGRGVPDHVMYEAGSDYIDYQIGFGYLPNHHCLLNSLDPRYPVTPAPYDDTLANRYTSPGAGAFSYNRGREFTSTRHVEAGEELFMSYGYCQHGKGPWWTDEAYMPAEFKRAAQIVWDRIRPNAPQQFHYDTQHNRPHKLVWEDAVLGPDTDTVHTKLVEQLLPHNRQEVQALAAAPISSQDALPLHLAHTKGVTRRSVDWIQEHGMCLETLTARPSTLPHAGQGGFAQTPVKQGDIVILAPLLHIMDRDVLALYDDNDISKVTGTQLLLNYCFANAHSSVLLCPTTTAVLINHCSTRQRNNNNNSTCTPNADYRWSSGWDKESDQWRTESLDELRQKTYRGLSFEIFATRDIAPGEEVFMDYGPEWEGAWERHVQNWKPPPPLLPKNQPWVSAKAANEAGGQILPELMLTKNNVYETVHHPYLMTGCVYWKSWEDRQDVYQEENADVDWKQMDAAQVLKRYATDGAQFHYSYDEGYARHEDGIHWPCSVLWRDADSGKYVVRMHQHPTYGQQPWDRNGVPRLLTNFKRNAIRYFVKPYASDQHLAGAFRQPIGMRDDIFPEQWKNLP